MSLQLAGNRKDARGAAKTARSLAILDLTRPKLLSGQTLLQGKCACGATSGLTGTCSDCERKKLLGQPLQTKLRINEPGDEYEQEADRVAEQVMRVALPGKNVTIRSAPLLQRKANASSAGVSAAPPVVNEVLSSPGQPLNAATRAFFEPRFGYDFGIVRVHTDARASESARAVNALAYTVGHQIVLDSNSCAGMNVQSNRLLAHELAHVVQQVGRDKLPQSLEADGRYSSNAQFDGLREPRVLRPRLTDSYRQVRRTSRNKPNLDIPVFDRLRQSATKPCSDQEKSYIEEAYRDARQWLDRSIIWIKALTSGLFSFSKIQEPGRAALETHFKSSDKDTAATVLLNLERIRGNIPTRQEFLDAGSPVYQQNISIGSGPQVPITIRAITCNSAECKPSTGAYYRPGVDSITFCPYFFRHRKDQGPGLLIHEIAHSLGFGGVILDFAYAKDRLYTGLTTAEALLNADSYANLVEELATGKTRRMIVPRDSLGKCPEDWVPLVNAAIARAHQWARVADKVYSGPSSDPAAVAYQKVRDGLEKSVRITCKASGAPKCQAGNIWFHEVGDAALFLCPDWKALGEDDRTVAVLAGLIGYFAGPGGRADWEKYAVDAAALTRSKLYPTPPSPPQPTGHP